MQLVVASAENGILAERGAHVLAGAAAKSMSPSRQATYTRSRGLLGLALERFYGLPQLPVIATLPQGKPYFTEYPHLAFNLSHSRAVIALSVGAAPQGVDVELIRERHDLDALIERTCSTREQQVLFELPKAGRAALFHRLWTLRECALKTTGEGLAGLDKVKVNLERGKICAPALPKGRICSWPLKALDSSLPEGFLSVFVGQGEKLQIFLLQQGELRQLERAQSEVLALQCLDSQDIGGF